MAESPKAFSDELYSELRILHLVYYKNKNQHRLTTWWKYVSILHRRGMQLVDLLKGPAKKHEESTRLARFIYHKVIPPAHAAFSGIIKQSFFLALGFSLIAILSRIHSLIGVFLGKFGAPKPKNPAHSSEPLSSGLGPVSEDLGEVIARDVLSPVVKLSEDDKMDYENTKEDIELKDDIGGSDKNQEKKKSQRQKQKEKREKNAKKKSESHKNAIDQIFGF